MSSAARGPPADRLPFRDPALPLRKRVDDLLDRLTLDERIAMLHQYAPAVPRLGSPRSAPGPRPCTASPGSGAATVFPQAVGLGATWDEELVRARRRGRVGRAARLPPPPPARSSAPAPHSLQAWAPVVNLLRDPRWGRNEEGYSEDPVHTARLAIAFCRGLAGDHPRYLRTAPVLKHFLAYNNEDDRCTTSSGLRPRVLHEYDLAAFRPVIAAGAATGAMAAYNLVNGRPCHVSPLIETELRAGRGRPAMSCSWSATPRRRPTWSTRSTTSTTTPSPTPPRSRPASTASPTTARTAASRSAGCARRCARGLIDEADVDRAVRRQLLIRFRLGEFDPDLDPYAGIGPEVIDCAEHRALARRAATESVVLLKQRRTAAARGPQPRIAVIGPLADTLCEDWYSGTMPYRITVADGLRRRTAATWSVWTGSDRIALRSRTTGELLGKTAFDVVDWGGGVLTLRSADTGRYLSLQDDDARWPPTRS